MDESNYSVRNNNIIKEKSKIKRLDKIKRFEIKSVIKRTFSKKKEKKPEIDKILQKLKI